VKDGQIEELAREIEMYYGVKRHLEELTKENQEISRRLAMLDSENQKLRLEVGGDNIGSAPACQVGEEESGFGYLICVLLGAISMLLLGGLLACARKCQDSARRGHTRFSFHPGRCLHNSSPGSLQRKTRRRRPSSWKFMQKHSSVPAKNITQTTARFHRDYIST